MVQVVEDTPKRRFLPAINSKREGEASKMSSTFIFLGFKMYVKGLSPAHATFQELTACGVDQRILETCSSYMTGS